MSIYALSLNTTVVTTTVPSWDIRASSTNQPRVMELGANLGAATASTYGYGRSANSPTQTGGVAVLAENPNDPTGQSTCAVAWTVAPTVPANFFRRVFLPGTIGAGIIYTFPRGIILSAAAATLVQWNIAASAASNNVHVVVDE